MRIRTIKPEFWLHEGLCSLPEFTRLLAIALLNWADDEGYFMANPAILRGSLFPFLDDSKKIPRSLNELSGVGWIDLGKDQQGRDVGRVRNFGKHQRVDKPRASEIKASSSFQEYSTNSPRKLADASEEEWNGMDHGNGTAEGNGIISAPSAWCPTVGQVTVGQFFKRKPMTPWSAKELKVWNAIPAEVRAEGIDVLSPPYFAEERYCRRDLLTLLNNWQGEIDRWRSYKPALRSDVQAIEEDGELGFLSNDEAIFHKDRP